MMSLLFAIMLTFSAAILMAFVLPRCVRHFLRGEPEAKRTRVRNMQPDPHVSYEDMMHDSRAEPEVASVPAPKRVTIQPFIPCSQFQGSRNGYVFKMDDLGLGYYLDSQF